MLSGGSLQEILRAQKYLDTPSAVIQFKSRILSYVEHRTAAIYHADSIVLEPVDRQYDRFISAMNLTRKDALFSFSLAPLSSRRDMAMLGVIHRSILGKGPSQIRRYFELEGASNHPSGRATLRRHNQQIRTYRKGKFLETTSKSILGLIDIYNLLPQEFIDSEDVHSFQTKLQGLLKEEVHRGRRGWESMFSPRHPLHLHPLVVRLNAVNSIQAAECDPNNVTDVNGVLGPFNLGDASIAPIDLPPSWWGRMR